MRHIKHGLSLWLCVFLAAAGLSACAAGETNALSSTTSTTTTTLPPSHYLTGTDPVGSLSSLGPIWRVAVVPLAARSYEPPAYDPLTQALPKTVKIGYRQFGSGPDLLLIMGQRGSMTWWDPQLLSDLAGHYRVTIFDLPDVGYSAPAPGRPSINASADVTAGLIYALGLTRPSVLGWGIGGSIALALAARHARFVDRLILVDATAGGSKSLAPNVLVQAALSSTSATMTELSSLFFPRSSSQSKLGWLTSLSQVLPDDVVASSIRAQSALAASLYKTNDLVDELTTVKLPALVVFGAHDEVVPPQNGELLVSELQDAQRAVFPDAGYASMFEDEPRFVQLLVQFLH